MVASSKNTICEKLSFKETRLVYFLQFWNDGRCDKSFLFEYPYWGGAQGYWHIYYPKRTTYPYLVPNQL